MPQPLPPSRRGKDIIEWTTKKRRSWRAPYESENDDEGSNWNGTQPDPAPRAATRKTNRSTYKLHTVARRVETSEDEASSQQRSLVFAQHGKDEVPGKDGVTGAHDTLGQGKVPGEDEVLDGNDNPEEDEIFDEDELLEANEGPYKDEIPYEDKAPAARSSGSDQHDTAALDIQPFIEPSLQQRVTDWLGSQTEDASQQQTQLQASLTQLAALAEGIPFALAQQEDSDDEALSEEVDFSGSTKDEVYTTRRLPRHSEDNSSGDETHQARTTRPGQSLTRNFDEHFSCATRPHQPRQSDNESSEPETDQVHTTSPRLAQPARSDHDPTAQNGSPHSQASPQILVPRTPSPTANIAAPPTKLYPIFNRRPATVAADVDEDTPLATYISTAVNKAREAKAEIYNNQGLLALAQHTLEQENTAFATLDGAAENPVISKGYAILAASHPEIVKACIRGSWVKEIRHNKELNRILRRLRKRADTTRHPFVYLNELSSGTGDAPTPNELLKAAAIADNYLSNTDRALVRRVDSWIRPLGARAQQTPGYQRYLYNAEYRRSSKRTGRALAFLRHLRARVESVPAEERDTPISVPLLEVGYSDNIPDRLSRHRRHEASNFLMNLFEAILGVQCSDRYHLHQFVIHSCVAQAQVAVAELLFTRLNEGYIGNAGGFSFYPAGISVGTRYTYTAAHWEEAEQWAFENMLVDEVHEAESRRNDMQEVEEEIRTLIMQRSAIKQELAGLRENMAEDDDDDDFSEAEGEANLAMMQDKHQCVQVYESLAAVANWKEELGLASEN